MFSPEDFVVPLEKELKVRVILDEIDGCTDVAVLQDNLKQCTKTLVSYQHILAKVTERQLKSELEKFIGIMEVTEEQETNAS
jgi:DNA integrity scanning protein DisA with diadenylate cyclase activity